MTGRALIEPAFEKVAEFKVKTSNDIHDRTPAEHRATMTWAQRLKRVFSINIETSRESLLKNGSAAYTVNRYLEFNQ